MNIIQKLTTTVCVILLFGVGLIYYQNTILSDRLKAIESSSNEANGLPNGFTHVHDRFYLYNNDIDTTTIINFIEVSDHFGLKSDKDVFELAIGQIIVESGAKQYYGNAHKNFGKVIRGSSGEVGIAQIMPSTAISYLTNYVKDMNELMNLGASDFKFVHNKSLSDSDKTKLVITWLSDERNNLILWGFIMRDNLQKNGVIKALVAYNAGVGGMESFNDNNDIYTHSYIRTIKDTLKFIKLNLNV